MLGPQSHAGRTQYPYRHTADEPFSSLNKEKTMLTLYVATLMFLMTLCPVASPRGRQTNDTLLAGSAGIREWRLDRVRGDSKGSDDDKDVWVFGSNKFCTKREGGTKTNMSWYFEGGTNLLHVGDKTYFFKFDGPLRKRDRMSLTKVKNGKLDDNEIYDFSSPAEP